MSARVSIVIASFNAAKTVARALDSVLSQSFHDWECIVVDGASKDGTVDIVKGYCEKDSRFKFISEPDNGIYDAFNKGWRMATGEWVYYLGADDILLKDALLGVSKYMDEEVDALYGDMYFDTQLKLKKKISMEPACLKGFMVSHQSLFMKRTCIENLGGFDLKYQIVSDFALVQKAVAQGLRFKHINVFIAIFQGGGVSSVGCKNLFEAYKIRNEYNTAPKIINMYYLFKHLLKKNIKQRLIKVLLKLIPAKKLAKSRSAELESLKNN